MALRNNILQAQAAIMATGDTTALPTLSQKAQVFQDEAANLVSDEDIYAFTQENFEDNENMVYDFILLKACGYDGDEAREFVHNLYFYDACGHVCNHYESNNDATYHQDGTKTGVCMFCGDEITVTDEGSMLIPDNSAMLAALLNDIGLTQSVIDEIDGMDERIQDLATDVDLQDVIDGVYPNVSLENYIMCRLDGSNHEDALADSTESPYRQSNIAAMTEIRNRVQDEVDKSENEEKIAVYYGIVGDALSLAINGADTVGGTWELADDQDLYEYLAEHADDIGDIGEPFERVRDYVILRAIGYNHHDALDFTADKYDYGICDHYYYDGRCIFCLANETPQHDPLEDEPIETPDY